MNEPKALAARGLRSHTASVDEPHVVLIIDELATLTALADRAVTNRFEKALGLPADAGQGLRDHRRRRGSGSGEGRRRLA